MLHEERIALATKGANQVVAAQLDRQISEVFLADVQQKFIMLLQAVDMVFHASPDLPMQFKGVIPNYRLIVTRDFSQAFSPETVPSFDSRAVSSVDASCLDFLSIALTTGREELKQYQPDQKFVWYYKSKDGLLYVVFHEEDAAISLEKLNILASDLSDGGLNETIH